MSTATVKINGLECPVNGEANILELARNNKIEIPSFCYHSELSVYGACRMCLVDIEGMGLCASCSTAPRDGMTVNTNSQKAQAVRKTVLELLLANHDRECTTCDKNGSCRLQKLAYQLGVDKIRFGEKKKEDVDELPGVSVVRNPEKCILCGDCVRVCREVQGIGVLEFANRGPKTTVGPAFGKTLAEVECVNCGQCVAVCPTGALTARNSIRGVWEKINDPQVKAVAQIAPAVRVALGEEFGLGAGEIATGKVVAALRRIGFDYVFDTVFSADLTSLEETHEFVERFSHNERLPHMTSCCPGWIKYCEQYHPELLKNLSTCRSPQQMFGSLVKRFWAPEQGLDPQNVYMVSVMPCTAKKFEAERPEFARGGTKDVDAVLTTVEIARMIKESGVVFEELDPEAFDMPLGLSTGAGVIYGVSGGVAEAVLRTAYNMLTGGKLDKVDFTSVRGFEGVKTASVEIEGKTVRLAIANGLANAERLIQGVAKGEVLCDIIEVMACPGGCIGGGGQPVPNDTRARAKRARGLYSIDRDSQLRHPTMNIYVQKAYDKWLGGPGSPTAHEVLHTHYASRRRITGEVISDIMPVTCTKPLTVSVCVGTGCYTRGSYRVLESIMDLSQKSGLSDRIEIKATFCLEHCGEGVSVKVGDEIMTGFTPDNTKSLWHEKILPAALAPMKEALD